VAGACQNQIRAALFVGEVTVPTKTAHVHVLSDGDFSPGRYFWLLRDLRRVKPFAFTGRQGFFQVPDELIHYEVDYP
jgi:hypothetical protein